MLTYSFFSGKAVIHQFIFREANVGGENEKKKKTNDCIFFAD
jgi:hypothetical protein